MTDEGLNLVDVYLSDNGVLTGSAREAQKLTEITGEALRTHALNQKDVALNRKRKVLEAKIASLQEEFESVQDVLNKSYIEEDLKKEIMEKNRRQMVEKRQNKNGDNGHKRKNSN
jgi:circadian clock protein KaiC